MVKDRKTFYITIGLILFATITVGVLLAVYLEWNKRSLYDQTYTRIRDVIIKASLEKSGSAFTLQEQKDRLDIYLGNQRVAAYCYASHFPKPYIAPLCTPSGLVLTRTVEEQNGKDHPHHQGLFLAYGNVNNLDFWGNRGQAFQIRHVQFLDKSVSQDGLTIETLLEWTGSDGSAILQEQRTLLFTAFEGGYKIHFKSRLKACREVILGDTKEGLLAIRVADWFCEKGGCGLFYSSTGKQSAADIWGTSEEWVCLVGHKDHKQIGLAIRNDPASFNFPTYWHVRDYGLFAANPLGQLEFQTTRKVNNPVSRTVSLNKGQQAEFIFDIMVYEQDFSGK
jgi:hypothetical protein